MKQGIIFGTTHRPFQFWYKYVSVVIEEKTEMLIDYRQQTLNGENSSHGLWPGEILMIQESTLTFISKCHHPAFSTSHIYSIVNCI
jgi:hypothetical protein